MIAESSEVQKFRQMIGDAPEFTQPCKLGEQELSYTICKVNENIGKGILETEPDELGRFIRAEYNADYGFTAKKIFSLWQNGEE